MEYTPLSDLFKEYSAARNKCINLFYNINYIPLGFDSNPAHDYTFIFNLRETTLAMIIEHYSDRDYTQYPEEYNFSTVIPKDVIISRRLDYAVKNNNDPNKIQLISGLQKLVADKFIKDSFFSLFNDDYRKSIDVLLQFIKEINNLSENYFAIKESYPVNTSVGSNGFFIRILCNFFFENKYFDNLLFIDNSILFGSPTPSSINISRLILVYLNNNKNENNILISIKDILNDFGKLFEEKMVIKAIWYLFSLRKEPFWNHLITFDKLSGLENFQGRNINDDILFDYIDLNSTIKITSAGTYFLDNILTHFEYYSCRMNKSNNNFDVSISLFDKENAKFDGINFMFDPIIQSTIDYVKDCNVKLKNFYETNFVGKLGCNDNSFLESNFSYHIRNVQNNEIKSMFHIERVIHSHIDYLDVYRRYVMNLLDNNLKKDANERIINYIKQYINMFGYYDKSPKTHYSEQSKTLCKYYDNCIKEIEKSDFTDPATPIDRVKGRELNMECLL